MDPDGNSQYLLTVRSEHVFGKRYFFRSIGSVVRRRKVELLAPVLESRGLRLGISRKHDDHEQIVADFDAAIAAMKADGTYNNILGQYRISN